MSTVLEHAHPAYIERMTLTLTAMQIAHIVRKLFSVLIPVKGFQVLDSRYYKDYQYSCNTKAGNEGKTFFLLLLFTVFYYFFSFLPVIFHRCIPL